MLIVRLPQERLWLVVHRCVQACLLLCCMARVYSQEGCLPAGMHVTTRLVWEHMCVTLCCLVHIHHLLAARKHQTL